MTHAPTDNLEKAGQDRTSSQPHRQRGQVGVSWTAVAGSPPRNTVVKNNYYGHPLVPCPVTSCNRRSEGISRCKNYLSLTPADARRIWESTPNPSSRRVARKFEPVIRAPSHDDLPRAFCLCRPHEMAFRDGSRQSAGVNGPTREGHRSPGPRGHSGTQGCPSRLGAIARLSENATSPFYRTKSAPLSRIQYVVPPPMPLDPSLPSLDCRARPSATPMDHTPALGCWVVRSEASPRGRKRRPSCRR